MPEWLTLGHFCRSKMACRTAAPVGSRHSEFARAAAQTAKSGPVPEWKEIATFAEKEALQVPTHLRTLAFRRIGPIQNLLRFVQQRP